MKYQHFKAGNLKISRNCLISTLPTHVCFGQGKQCKGCYAMKAEKQYKAVVAARERHLEFTQSATFVQDAIAELKQSKNKIVRIHESGDFYSQAYVDAYVQIATACPEKMFYFWTKKGKVFDFSALAALPNVNMMESYASDGGYNYGNMERCEQLQAEGFFLCPCGIDKNVECMGTCFECLNRTKVCFLKH